MADLNEEDLPGLLEIIRPGSPVWSNLAHTNLKADNEVLEVNIEELDDATLLAVQKYVTRCKKTANTKKR